MSINTETQTTSAGTLFERAATLLPELAVDAAKRERERIMPYDEIRRIADAGLFTFRVPTAYGGPGSSLEELFKFLIDLAAVDSNIAQALRPGFLTIESLVRSEDEEERALWFARILDGAIIGNAGWERGGPNGEVRTTIRPLDDDRFVVNGTKSYSTGALFSDWVGATAKTEDGEVVWFVVPRDRAGMRLIDDWDAAGQRLTASGTTELEDMTVYGDEIRHRFEPEGRSPVVAVAQLFLGAVLAGIARNALADAAAYARNHARPIVHSSATRSVDDPYVQHAVGEISARAFAAEAGVLSAARSIDQALAPGAEPELLTEAAIDVAQAQFVASEAALRSSELLFEVGGASTTLKEHNLDRHWRNARTVANHNPRAYKAAVVGAYRLTGTEPPTSGLF